MSDEKIQITDNHIKFIVDMRKECGITAYQLSEMIGKNKSWLPNIENKRIKSVPKKEWNILLKQFAELSETDIKDLLVKFSKYISTNNEKIILPNTSKSNNNWIEQHQPNVAIIYEGHDITGLVKAEPGCIERSTKERLLAYSSYLGRSGNALYARRYLIDFLDELKQITNSNEIYKNLDKYVEYLKDNVIYWYKRCWNNIDDLFAETVKNTKDLNTLYDLIDICLSVDLIAQQEFTLIPIEIDHKWLRELLKDPQ